MDDDKPNLSDSSFVNPDDAFDIPTYEPGTTFWANGIQWTSTEKKYPPSLPAFRGISFLVKGVQVGKQTEFLFHIREDGIADKIGLASYL